MSRKEAEYHQWIRVGPTRDHTDGHLGSNWPTCPAVCTHCREYRPDMAVSLLEGTLDTPLDYFPGRCPMGIRPPADTSWVGFETTGGGLGPTGRGILRAFASALFAGCVGMIWVVILTDWTPEPWMWLLAAALFGLATGLEANLKDPKPKKG